MSLESSPENGFMASAMSLNCSKIVMPSGIRKSGDSRLATQRLPFESSATPRTLIPTRKVSTFDGSLAGKQTFCAAV